MISSSSKREETELQRAMRYFRKQGHTLLALIVFGEAIVLEVQ